MASTRLQSSCRHLVPTSPRHHIYALSRLRLRSLRLNHWKTSTGLERSSLAPSRD